MYIPWHVSCIFHNKFYGYFLTSLIFIPWQFKSDKSYQIYDLYIFFLSEVDIFKFYLRKTEKKFHLEKGVLNFRVGIVNLERVILISCEGIFKSGIYTWSLIIKVIPEK